MASAGKKIVVAVDASDSSEIAFRWILHNLAKKPDHIFLIHSAPYVGPEFPDPDIANEYFVSPCTSVESSETEKMVTEQSKILLNRFLEECQEAGISCEGEVVKGEPGSWIVDEANRLSADVIVVGRSNDGLIKRTILGGVSDYVLHNAHCPVVIVRPSEALQKTSFKSSEQSRKIVIAVDDSKEAFYAFVWSLQNFCTELDKVVIYHVHHSAAPAGITAIGTGAFGMEEVYFPPETTDEIEVQALNDSEKLVEKFMAYASRESKISCEGKVVTGETEAKVCEGLTELQADAVVVGTHNRGAIARTFLGSVSDYLAYHSPCTLIVVKKKHTNANNGDQDLPHSHDL